MAATDSVWDAVRFEQVMTTGRTRPMLLECASTVAHLERRGRFIVKALGLPEVTTSTLCHEFLGCRLAQLFGLKAPDSVPVDLSSAFVAVTFADLERERVHVKPGLAVGIEYVRNLFPFPSKAVVAEHEVTAAARIYTFDLAVQNPDRTRIWPNCGRSPEGLVPYDFENAFSFRLALSTPEPWQAGRLGFTNKHLFHAQLKSTPVDWPAVFGPMRRVTRTEVEAVCGTIPDPWRTASVEIQDHLVRLLAHWSDFESEVVSSIA